MPGRPDLLGEESAEEEAREREEQRHPEVTSGEEMAG